MIVLRPCYFLEQMLCKCEIKKKKIETIGKSHLSPFKHKTYMYIMCIDHKRLKLVDKQLVRYCIKFVI